MVHFKYQVLTVLLASGVVSVLSAPVSGSGSGTVLPPVSDEGRPSTGDTEMTDAIPGSNPRNPGSRGRRPLGSDPLRAGQAMQQGQQPGRNWRISRSSNFVRDRNNRPGRQISIEDIGRRVILKYSGDLHTLDTSQSIENAAALLPGSCRNIQQKVPEFLKSSHTPEREEDVKKALALLHKYPDDQNLRIWLDYVLDPATDTQMSLEDLMDKMSISGPGAVSAGSSSQPSSMPTGRG